MLTMATQVVLALLLLVWSAEAQRRPVISGGGGHGGQVAGPGVVRGGLGGGFRHRRNFNQAYPYVLGSYGWPGSYGDFGCAGSEPEYSHEGPEPQRSALLESKPMIVEPPIEPMLLELRGDGWVKVATFGDGTQPSRDKSITWQPLPKPKEVPPAILVYRDGHMEQIASYSIIGNTIYVKSDYWTTGTWTRAIQIPNLNIGTTLKLNQEHGTQFQLPSSPNEVIMRP